MFSPKFAADLAQNLNTLVAQLQQQQQAQQGKKAN
jgi:hypothetical protein